MTTETKCTAHRWVLPSPGTVPGPTWPSTCRLCGAERTFPAVSSIERDNTWTAIRDTSLRLHREQIGMSDEIKERE